MLSDAVVLKIDLLKNKTFDCFQHLPFLLYIFVKLKQRVWFVCVVCVKVVQFVSVFIKTCLWLNWEKSVFFRNPNSAQVISMHFFHKDFFVIHLNTTFTSGML